MPLLAGAAMGEKWEVGRVAGKMMRGNQKRGKEKISVDRMCAGRNCGGTAFCSQTYENNGIGF
jgi:hypothetical protein